MYWLFCVTVTCESGECKSLRSQYAFSILCLCFFLFILQFTFNYAHLYVRMCVCVITSLVQTLNCSDCHYQRGRTQMYVYMCVDQLGRRQGFPQWRRGGSYLGVHYVCCTNGLFIFAARVTFLLLQLLLPLVLSLLFLFLLYTTNVRALPKCYFNWGEPCCDYFVVVFSLVADAFIFHFLILTTLCAIHF